MTSSDRVTEAARRVEWSRGLRVWHRHKFDVITDAMALADAEIAAAVLAASPAVTGQDERAQVHLDLSTTGEVVARCGARGPSTGDRDRATCPACLAAPSPAVTAAEEETRDPDHCSLIAPHLPHSWGPVDVTNLPNWCAGRPAPVVAAVPAEGEAAREMRLGNEWTEGGHL